MNVIGASILASLVVVICFAPRRWAAIGMMAGVLYLTMGESIQLLSLNLYAMRFLEVAGFMRVTKRREFNFSKLNEIDRAVILLYGYTTIVFLLRSSKGQAYQIGTAVDALTCYFIFRGLISSPEDFNWFLNVFVILLTPYIMFLTIERLTTHNPLGIVGASEAVIFREGIPRCHGSFQNSSLLGTLGASFLPLYIGLVLERSHRIRAFAGTALCLAIVLLSNSGGPVAAAGIGVVGWFFWWLRSKMLIVRRGLVGFFAFLALVMKAPIWFLPARISDIIGGDGYHRSALIDHAIRDLDKWWLAGMSITQTRSWFPYVIYSTGGADITNQFIYFGLSAGLGAIVLFIFLLGRAFRKVGETLAEIRSDLSENSHNGFLLWGLGVTLAVHIVNWIGIRYFDQIYVVFFMQLAAISAFSKRSME